jgi:hypothetical protein
MGKKQYMLQEQPMQLWAFLENSDFQRRKGGKIIRHDEVKLIRHDEFLEHDYQLMKDIGCVGIRDAARWYITHSAPGKFDWIWLDKVVESAQKIGLVLYLDLWHYGYPDWLNIMNTDAPVHFAEFASQIAHRYPAITHYCVSNEPSLLVDWGGRLGRWRPFQRRKDTTELRRQICKMIIAASKAILDIRPEAQLILPEPWHATDSIPEDTQAAVLDTVMGLRDADLGGTPELVTVVGLNHYRDSTIPPFHQRLLDAKKRWTEKPLWFTETSGPPTGWQQTEWFWWMLAETRLANLAGAKIPVFTWAPAISMYDWFDEKKHLKNGIWVIEQDGRRTPNSKMLEAIDLARQYGYLL